MEYQKVAYLIDRESSSESSKFKTKNWVEINDESTLWQYYRGETNNNLVNSKSFKSKIKITGRTPANGNEKDVEIMVPLKYLSNFWRTLEMLLINCEVSLILTWFINLCYY